MARSFDRTIRQPVISGRAPASWHRLGSMNIALESHGTMGHGHR